MVVSPDPHPEKEAILGLIAEHFPQLRMQIIRNLSYEDYKQLISKAKWALTFGEGLDGYFVETIFSGGVSLAVYNTSFFTPDFETLPTVYASYETLSQRVISDLKKLDNDLNFKNYQEEQYQICSGHYNYKNYTQNVASFYSTYFSAQEH